MIKLVIQFKQSAYDGTFDLRYARNLALLRKMPGIEKAICFIKFY